MIALTVENASALRWLAAVSGRMDEKMRLVVAESAETTADSIRYMLSRNGRHAPNTKTPSAPGDTPSMISTDLRESVHVENISRVGLGRYSAAVGPDTEYAAVQEFGHGHVPARPYMERAGLYAQLMIEERVRVMFAGEI